MLIEVTQQELAHIELGLELIQTDITAESGSVLLGKSVLGHMLFDSDEIDNLKEHLTTVRDTIYIVWDNDMGEVLGHAKTYEDACTLALPLDDVVVRPFLTGR